MVNADFLDECIVYAREDSIGSPISPITTAISDFGFTKDFAEDTQSSLLLAQNSDSNFEAQSDYYGLPSNPV